MSRTQDKAGRFLYTVFGRLPGKSCQNEARRSQESAVSFRSAAVVDFPAPRHNFCVSAGAMNHYYAACELGVETGRICMGTLEEERLTVSEMRRFEHVPVKDKKFIGWNVPQLYHDVVEGLRTAGGYDEPVESVSCTSSVADYLLFQADGTLLTPSYHPDDPRTESGMEKVLAKLPWEAIYEDTGVQRAATSTLFRLAAESPKRFKSASHLLPMADGFNYLLSGMPRIEKSLASAMQLYNPETGSWSERLLEAIGLPAELLPPLVDAGTELGLMRPEVAEETRLKEARVIASCSHELAAALAGLPVSNAEKWLFWWPGNHTLIGTQIAESMVHDASREMNFTNQPGYGGSVSFYKHTVGLRILEECRRFWEQTDRGLDDDMLGHLAGSAMPFESLVDPTDARFAQPGDMPLKIQAFCKDTNQPVPHRPGPIYRCILESLALLHRKTLQELEYLTSSKFARVYLLGGKGNSLLNHFTANALQLPLVIAPSDTTVLGNIIVQALSLKHLESIQDARDLVRASFKLETIVPHAAAWNSAFDRFLALTPVAA